MIRPFLVIRKQMNHRPDPFLIRLASDMFILGTYAIRPYPNRRKIATMLIRSVSDMLILGEYAMHPYSNRRKIAMISIRLPHSNLKNAQILIHRQKMILKLTGTIYPRAIQKINPDAYTFLFV